LLKQISYKKFSLHTHLINIELGRPNTCQLELTYACDLRCPHCYVGSYNRPEYIARELDTATIKKVVDELKSIGILWLCFTGGDPLVRPDFCELYAYAREQGFVVTVFTNGYSLRREHIELFKRQPPFSIEITLNAVEEKLYEKISGVKDSFKKVMAAIDALRRNKLPLKIKTAVTKDNVRHIAAIKKYARGHELNLTLDEFLHAGLGFNRRPLKYRLPPEYFYGNNKLKGNRSAVKNPLFPCVASGGDGFQIGPYGHISACCLIRKPDLNVLKNGVGPAVKEMVEYFRGLEFTTDSKCKTCAERDECGWCPGKAFVETGSLEKPIDYCCQIVKDDDK
jgi:radical SAM protein with 4Fe4S-binding SPASM domain